MFEFEYCVDLKIVHPHLDPDTVSKRLTEFAPEICSRAGDERLDRAGRPLGRKSQLTVWSASMHSDQRLDSATTPISAFLKDALAPLVPHRQFFEEINAEGQVMLRIGCFSDTNHTAAILDAGVLQLCGGNGIGIEIHFYAIND